MNKKKFILFRMIVSLIIGLGALVVIPMILNALSNKTSLITDSTCNFPCWNHVEFGKTNKAELLKILAKVSSIKQDTISISNDKSFNGFEDETVSFNIGPDWTGRYQNSGRALLLHDRVLELSFDEFSFNKDTAITLQQTIQKLGIPDYISSNYIGDTTGIQFSIFFIKKGVFGSFYLGSKESNITPEQHITYLSLFDPNLTNSYQKEPMWSIRWKGYGKFSDKYSNP